MTTSVETLKRIRENAGASLEEIAQAADLPVEALRELEDTQNGTYETLNRVTKAMGAEIMLMYTDGVILDNARDPIITLLEHHGVWTELLKLPSQVPYTVEFQMRLYTMGQRQFLTAHAVDAAARALNFEVVFVRRVQS
jgi:transcriptional regulator with XRE-family HTH domain